MPLDGAGVGAGVGTGVGTVGVGVGTGCGVGFTTIGLEPTTTLEFPPVIVIVLAAAAGAIDVSIITAVTATKNSFCDFIIINSPFFNATMFHNTYYIGSHLFLHLANFAFTNPYPLLAYTLSVIQRYVNLYAPMVLIDKVIIVNIIFFSYFFYES